MKCKNCGAPLTITQKFCDNCGAPNEQSKAHIDAMNQYGKEFNKTKQEVENNSKWFVEYIVPLTVLVISVIAAAFFVYADNSMISYDIAKKENLSYIAKHSEEIDTYLHALLDQGKYYELVHANNERRGLEAADDQYSWNAFYNAADAYETVRKSMISYYDENMESYRRDSAISQAASGIYDFYSAQKGHYIAEESKTYLADLKIQFETFVKAYCHLTDEDIEKLPNMEQTAVLTLVTRRMADEDIDANVQKETTEEK